MPGDWMKLFTSLQTSLALHISYFVKGETAVQVTIQARICLPQASAEFAGMEP